MGRVLLLERLLSHKYMTDAWKLDEAGLLPKVSFYNDLANQHNTSPMSSINMQRRYGCWTCPRFAIGIMSILTLNVVLLADVFEAFHQTMFKSHGLGCLHFPSLSSMNLQLT